MRRTAILLVAILGLSLFSQAQAQDGARGSLAAGIQAAPLTFGISIKYAVSDWWKLQGVLSPATSDTAITLRVLRTAQAERFWQSYLFGGLAVERLAYSFDGDQQDDSVVSVGMGVEWGWQARNLNLPPLHGSLEFGLGYNSDEYSADGFVLVLGLSRIHI